MLSTLAAREATEKITVPSMATASSAAAVWLPSAMRLMSCRRRRWSDGASGSEGSVSPVANGSGVDCGSAAD